MNEVEELLAARGGAELDHPGGTLLAHLRRIRDTLSSWGAREELRLAGLAHAAYGTDGFPHGLLDLGERATLADLIGAEAEGIVYTYCSCDRGQFYPLLMSGQLTLRDRFTGTLVELTDQQVRDFVELTFANELDVLSHNEDLLAAHGDGLRRLFAACRPYASVPAYDAFTGFFE